MDAILFAAALFGTGSEQIGRNMALQSCRECGKDVSTEARSCPHCGTPRPAGAATLSEEISERLQRGHEPRKRFIGSFLKGLAVVVVGLYLLSTLLTTLNPDLKHSPIAAHVYCKAFAEERLRSPTTAEFADYTNSEVADLGDGRYSVRTSVDAQNAFGAMIRSDVTCTVAYADAEDSWRLERISIGE